MDRIIVTLTEAQRQELMRIVNSGKSESRLVTRARIILDAADGVFASASARKLSVSRPMVVKWRGRFRDMGVDGLRDAPRSGQPVRYGDEFERKVLAVLDERPPEGYALWNGRLVARRLGVKADQVWRVMWLKKHPRVHFHYTPTNASWLNQVEVFFSILSRGALQGGSFESVSRLRGAINEFIAAYNERAVPFEWKKTCVNPKQLQNLYSN